MKGGGTIPGFTWGDSVRVKAGATDKTRPGVIAAIVGIRAIENETQALIAAS
jgi:hypothetical protein